MKNIAIIYKSNHASHRLVNATMAQYKSNHYKCQDYINIFPYCIGKLNQLRLDRFIERNEIALVYVHQEEKDTIKQLMDLGVDFFTYTRSDFCNIESRGWRYRTTYRYALINELLTCGKQSYGKIKKYRFSMDKLYEYDVFKCDEDKYKNYYNSEKEALSSYILELENWKSNCEKELDDYIKVKKDEIKKLSVKIDKCKQDYDKM